LLRTHTVMGKKKQIAIAESNLCNFGTDLEKNIKKAASECERAWDGTDSAGFRIWRIEKFKVVEWPRTELGKFYNGDSYIILHSYKPSASAPIKHDVHFWLGQNTSQDEAGTAAYKTVELDDRLDGAPVQHREVQNHESDLFLSYFPDRTIEILDGGIESGFHHVEEKKYPTRLLHVKGSRSNIRVTQKPLNCNSLNSGDAFILDLGMEIIQWNGSSASLFEKMRAGQVVRALRDERGGKPEAYVFEEGDTDATMNKFWDALGGKGKIKSAKSGGDDADAAAQATNQVKLLRLSDKKKEMQFTLEKTGNLSKSDLDTNDAFILDNGSEIFVWIGKKASKDERRLAMQYAQQYLQENNRPAYLPISRVIEGGENAVFDLNFSGGELSRDLNFNAADSPPSCCPHYPEGAAGAAAKANQQRGLSAMARKYGASAVAPGGSQYGQLESTANELFSVFKNKFHVTE